VLGFDTLAQAYGFGVSVGRSLGPNPGSKLKGPDEEQCGIELVIQFADADNVLGGEGAKKSILQGFQSIGIFFKSLKKEKKNRIDIAKTDFILICLWASGKLCSSSKYHAHK